VAPSPRSPSDFRLLADRPLWIRLIALYVGLVFFGTSCGLMIQAGLGNMPWDVLHQGLSNYLPLSVGAIAVILSLVVLLLWIPLRQRPGLGTISNALLVGTFISVTMAVVPPAHALWLQITYMVSGIVINAVATVLYIVPNFGPGPRDGLMTGLVEATGKPVFAVRTTIEVVVMAAGWLLGGRFFIGTILYALAIGPLTQLMLRLAVRLFGPADPLTSDEA
jgi:uncharacterized membrane protein YczE